VQTFVHRNAVLLQRDLDLLKQLFAFLAPHTCAVTVNGGFLSVTLTGPGMQPAQLVVKQANEPISTAYARAFGGAR